MTDGVARELEQAEARLARAREKFEKDHRIRMDCDCVEDVLDAAEEVGRLRALAEVELLAERWISYAAEYSDGNDYDGGVHDAFRICAHAIRAALAAREEVQG